MGQPGGLEAVRAVALTTAAVGVAVAAAVMSPPSVAAAPSDHPGPAASPVDVVAGVATGPGGSDGGEPQGVRDRLPQGDRRHRVLSPPAAVAGGVDPAPGHGRELDAVQRVALRAAGWAVPSKLANTWVLHSARVLTRGVGGSGTLQLVYTRGDQALSLFQRSVPPDWSSVPAGDEPVPELSGRVREWPGAKPARLMWEADGHTFVLMGRADRSALLEAAASLPAADAADLWDRLRRSVDRLLARLAI